MGKGRLWVVAIRVFVGTLCLIQITVLETEVFKEGSDVLCRVVAEYLEDISRGTISVCKFGMNFN